MPNEQELIEQDEQELEDSREDELEEEEYSEEDSDEDLEIEVVLPDGREHVLTRSDIVELVERNRQLEQAMSELSRLREYEQLANFVARDELTNRVALYRMQGNSPEEIVVFLYNYMMDNGMIDPETGAPVQREQQAQEGPDPEVAKLKSELEQLRSHLGWKAVRENNTEVLSQVMDSMGLEIEATPEAIELIRQISAEIYGNPDILLHHQITPQQARVILREFVERNKQKRSAKPQPKKAIVRPRNMPTQFPAKKPSGVARKVNLPKEYTMKNAEIAYKALFGD
jgi:hypothetical protein